MIIICKTHIPKKKHTKNLVFSMMKVHFIKVDAHQLLWKKLGTEFFILQMIILVFVTQFLFSRVSNKSLVTFMNVLIIIYFGS